MKKLLTPLLVFFSLIGFAQQDNADQVLRSLVDEKDSVVVQKRIDELKEGPEANYHIILRYYNVKRNMAMSRKVEEEAIKKFPQGEIAFDKYMFKFYEEKDVKKLEDMYTKVRAEFPSKNFERINSAMALAYLSNKDKEGAMKYVNQLNAPFSIQSAAQNLRSFDKSAAEALVKKHIDAGNKQANGYYNLVSLYSDILMEAGKEAEAMKYAADAYTNLRRKDDVLIRNYATLLAKSGKGPEALTVMETAIADGRVNDANKALTKQLYEKSNPGKDWNAYWQTVYAKFSEKVKVDVAKNMISKPSPTFVLKDINGKDVSLADFKGKTIVVDFWATWCVPCKKSFPAMNMALDKYRNDPNVKFLFVHTWERSETPQQDAMAYLKESGFKFDLYMDPKSGDQKKRNEVVSSFEVTGIPTKFVIDGNGNIRFKVLGFSGEDAAAAEELKAMIELARKG